MGTCLAKNPLPAAEATYTGPPVPMPSSGLQPRSLPTLPHLPPLQILVQSPTISLRIPTPAVTLALWHLSFKACGEGCADQLTAEC